MHKKQIDQIVIVEGKTDTIKLKKLFNVETIETNGSALNEQTLNLIKEVSLKKGIILFLDPDYMGEKIRRKIINYLDKDTNFVDLYVSKKDINNHSKKYGIAEASDESIIQAFKEIKTSNKATNSLSWQEYLTLELNNKNKRISLANKLNISYANNKQLYKRLNMLGLNRDEIFNLINYGNK